MTLREVVDAAVETTRLAIELGEHELSTELPEEPLMFEADRTRFVRRCWRTR